MHLNAIYRAAEAGKQALVDCLHELASAEKVRVRLPLKYWRRYKARRHLVEAKQHLEIVRSNLSRAALGEHRQIDSSGGYDIAELLSGGLLEELAALKIDGEHDVDEVNALLDQVGALMLRMRKCGAVG